MRVQPRTTAVAAALSAAAVVFSFTAQAAHAAPGDTRVAVDDAKPSWVEAAKPVADAAGGDRIGIRLYLALRDQSALEKAVEAVSTPGSPQYGRYITPEQFRARYAPTDATVGQVRSFLSGYGLSVTEIPANRHYVAASGTVEQVEKAFATNLKTFSKDGASVRAAAAPATIPSALADSVIAVSGLASHSRTMAPRHTVGATTAAKSAKSAARVAPKAGGHAPPPDVFVNARPCSTYFGEKPATGTPEAYGKTQPYAPCGYTPAQLQGAYGLTRSVAHGFDGRGVTVAITDAYAAPTILEDANTYAVRHGQAPFRPGQFKQVLPKDGYRYGYDDTVDGNLCDEQGWYGEETLDVEAVHAVAPRANIVYVASRSCDDGDFDDALNKVVDNQLADIVSNSWGSSGENTPDDLRKVYHQTFLQAALQGIGFYFSSGDAGDNSADNEDGSATVDSPVSDPLVTGVGGTSLSVNARNQHVFETGWGTAKSVLTDGAWAPAAPGPFVYGGGGGTSQVFAQPFYQRGVVPAAIAKRYGKPARTLPDIAAVGDPNTGMLVGETQTFPDGSVAYSEYRIGGTSLASPLMAGIMAIADQVYGRPHGFANPAIYALAGSRSLHDPKGNPATRAVVRVDYVNGLDDSEGLITSLRSLNVTQSIKVRPGYDDVTGVGTPNGESFLSSIGYRR